MVLDPSYLPLLRPRDYALYGFDVDAWVPFRVLRRRVSTFAYTFPKDVSGFNGAAGSTWKYLAGGAENIPVLANAPAGSYVANQSAGFQAVNGVTDVLQVSQDYEILQLFYGIAPSPLRVYPQQPISQYTTPLDQNIVPLQQNGQVIDVGFVDGFDSPYNKPSPVTEIHSFKNIPIQFSLANPIPESITPRLNFIVNRMKVSPVNDPEVVKGLFRGVIPAHVVGVGDAMGNVTWNGAGYGGIAALPSNLDRLPIVCPPGDTDSQGNPKPSILAVLQKFGYIKQQQTVAGGNH